jgi:GT2 family glycosyltransferase
MNGTWCVQYTLPQRRIESVMPRSPLHSSVRALVNNGGNPIGYVEFALPPGDLDADEVDREARAQLGPSFDHEVGQAAPPGTDEEWPFASVIVCTRNRPQEIRACLARLTALDYPEFEIVVVDNAPADDRTRAIVAGFERARYVVEPTPGLSHARNSGLATMHSEFAAYTDDDVSVDVHWLREIVRTFVADESVGCVTGMVCTADIPTALERYFDARASNWSSDLTAHTNSLAKHDLGALFPYTPGKFGTGANFAFRRKALEDIGGFDVALGAGTPTGGGEDLDAFVRVLLRGYAIAYTPRAIVWHHHRATAAELRKQMFSWGVGLGAFVLAHLSRRDTRRLVIRRVGSGFGQLVRTVRIETGKPKDVSDADAPRGLMLVELLGMVLSPYYYLKSRRQARAVRAGS